jgi:hypothetical protein
MGRTATIKQRAIWVYLPSIAMKDRWETYAKNAGTSLSKFVIEQVEDGLQREEESDYITRQALQEKLHGLQQQLETMLRDKRILETAVDRLEAELRRYRAQPFVATNFVGVRRYSHRLIDLLKRNAVISSDEILTQLGIDPTESDAVTAISKQLEYLEEYGLVQSMPRGWRWMA